MRKFFLVLTFFYSIVAFTQSNQFKISGTIVSEENNEPLEAATVFLQRVVDSSLITYTISDRNGKFTLENKSLDKKANFFVSYVGFQTYSKTIDLTNETINLEKVKLLINTNSLDEVVITSTPPITVKNDTLEFNVKSFKTKKDANIEELLKELPGVEVNEDGNITVNGKVVNRILVNGKPFFGDDPTITTRNLNKDIVEKIQILDTKTKDQAFTGEAVDGENKTVNLVIKKENNKGVFGRLAAGIGNNKQYEYAGMFNRFNDEQRISVLAGGNNINSPGFSFGDIRRMFGGGNGGDNNGRSLGAGEGITESQNYGINYADKFGEKVDLAGDYFYSGSNSENQNKSNRENILTDSRYFTTSNSSSFSKSNNHRANFELDIKVDSTLLINIEPAFRVSKNKTIYSEDKTSSDETNTLINQSSINSNVENTGKNFNNEIDITKRFGNNGAFLRLSMENEINIRESDDFLNSETNIFGDNPRDILRDQYTDGENKVNNFNSRLTYRLPLKEKEFFLEFQLDYSKNKQEDKKSTFDKDEGTNRYSNFNTELSADFIYINQTSTPSIELEYRKKDWSVSLEPSYVFRTLENDDKLRPEYSLKRDFQALELRARFRYNSPKASFRFGYNLENSPPKLSELQSFVDVSNPLNIVVGNPNLEPANEHRFYMRFNNFNFQKGSGVNGFFRANFQNNTVVRKTVIDENLVRETTYANVNGNYNISGNISISKKVKIDGLRTLSFDLGVGPNIRRNINFNNGVQYASNNTSLSPRFEMRLVWKDILEFNPVYRMNFTKNTFDIENFENQEFISHNLNLISTTFLPKGFEWRNNVQYNYNPNIADGFQKSAWFWNSTLAYSVLKEKGLITIKAYDLLNQNTNAKRIATQNYIEDFESKVLQQYFMLSFSWKFNSLGFKVPEEDRDGRGRRGGRRH